MVQHTIYLIRHGNSEGNKTRMFLTPEEDILTDLGKTQAADLGTALADVKFTKVYSSDYPRTLDTSQLVLSKSNYSRDIPIQKDERLREKQFGIYEGGTYAPALKDIAAYITEGKMLFEWYPEKAETWETMFDRSDAFFSELCSLLDKSKNSETVLLTSHAVFIQTFMFYLKKSEKLERINWDDCAIKVCRNCSFFKFTVEGNPDGFASKKRPLTMQKIHEWGHLDSSDSMIEFVKSPSGKVFQNCVQM